MTRRARLLALATFLVAATFAAYHGVLANGFVNYDDDLCVTNVQAVREGLTPSGVAWAFTTFHCANWFRLTWLSLMLDGQLFGLAPRGFHATSLRHGHGSSRPQPHGRSGHCSKQHRGYLR